MMAADSTPFGTNFYLEYKLDVDVALYWNMKPHTTKYVLVVTCVHACGSDLHVLKEIRSIGQCFMLNTIVTLPHSVTDYPSL